MLSFSYFPNNYSVYEENLLKMKKVKEVFIARRLNRNKYGFAEFYDIKNIKKFEKKNWMQLGLGLLNYMSPFSFL